MAKEIVRKRVTLHPLKEDGTIDTSINLYPKTFIDGIVDKDGEQVEVQEKLTAGDNITIENNVISASNLYKHYVNFGVTYDYNIGGELYIIDTNPNELVADKFFTSEYFSNVISVSGWINRSGSSWDDVICIQQEGEEQDPYNYHVRLYVLNEDRLQTFDFNSLHDIKIHNQSVKKL